MAQAWVNTILRNTSGVWGASALADLGITNVFAGTNKGIISYHRQWLIAGTMYRVYGQWMSCSFAVSNTNLFAGADEMSLRAVSFLPPTTVIKLERSQ